MDESRTTVGQAVDFEASFGDRLREELREKLSAVRAAVSGPVFEAVVDKVVERAAQVLDAPLADLLTGAWARYPEIQALCKGGDEERMAELCEHRFEWRYEPRVEVSVGEIPISIPLGVGVGLAVAGGVLVVQGGRMKELRSGKLALQVAMSVAAREVAKRERKVDLPAVLRFPARDAVPVGKIAAPPEPVAATS